ncbi:MAG: acyl carrier protein [Rhodospirillales bacterium]|nr:acyl carrier protein [Rhodospirillales bacterium]
MTDTIKAEIQSFVADYIRNHATGEEVVVDETTNFVDSRLLDSFAILSLILTLETQYSVRFQPQELVDPRLHTVGGLTQVINNKTTT